MIFVDWNTDGALIAKSQVRPRRKNGKPALHKPALQKPRPHQARHGASLGLAPQTLSSPDLGPAPGHHRSLIESRILPGAGSGAFRFGPGFAILN
jgi:hypothetical protein